MLLFVLLLILMLVSVVFLMHVQIILGSVKVAEWPSFGKSSLPYEPHCEKTVLRCFRSTPTQKGLYSHRRWLDV